MHANSITQRSHVVALTSQTPQVGLPVSSPDAAFDRSLSAVTDISAATDRTWVVVACGSLYVIEHEK